MNDKDSKLIYEGWIIQESDPLHWSMRQKEIKQKQKDAEIPRVTCHCHDCMSWSAGNKCVAENIELAFGQNAAGETTCECQTYTRAG
jgi:hypothetical protein